jgi:integrase
LEKRFRLTDDFARKHGHEAGQKEYPDRDLSGFVFRAGSRGGTWLIKYRLNGTQRRYTLGNFPAVDASMARGKAHTNLALVEQGRDLFVEDQRQDQEARVAAQEGGVLPKETFGYVARLYLERKSKPEKRSWKSDQRIINKELLPNGGSCHIAEIKRSDVRALVNKIAFFICTDCDVPSHTRKQNGLSACCDALTTGRGKGNMANRVLSVIKSIFMFALDEEIIENSPAASLQHPRKEKPRKRTLSDDEICKMWQAAPTVSRQVANVWRLALLTGQRSGEIAQMPWSELDLINGWWTIPSERTKNGLPQHLPLVGEALSILRAVEMNKEDSPYVFPGHRLDVPLTNIDHWQQLLMRKAGSQGWTFHDLRRTAYTGMCSIGILSEHVERVVNHKKEGVGGRHYNMYEYDREKREALEKWDRHVAETLKGEPCRCRDETERKAA